MRTDADTDIAALDSELGLANVSNDSSLLVLNPAFRGV